MFKSVSLLTLMDSGSKVGTRIMHFLYRDFVKKLIFQGNFLFPNAILLYLDTVLSHKLSDIITHVQSVRQSFTCF